MEPNKTTRTRNIVAQWVHLPAEKEIDQLIRVVAYAYECKDEISTKIACYEGRGPP